MSDTTQPPTTKETALQELIDIMERLRGPEGCPWDKEQDFSTLVPYIIEEAYEVVAAIDSGDKDDIKDELGDLLFQVIFLSRLGEEEGSFDIGDVIRGSVEKMTRRHPHVFENLSLESTDDVLKNWAIIKAEERLKKNGGKAKEDGYLSNIAGNLPALMHANKVSKKAAKVGFDWENIEQVLEKVDEELAELRQAIKLKDEINIEEELGDLLFAVTNVARLTKFDPENALRKTIGKFITRFHFIEKELIKKGKTLTDASLPEMEELWNRAKEESRI
ncbi:MAG: nucleoside triphosphate pyrophosphohydrolase [Proteobacteria bacterium]|nr:nucleoside triphosphate pyrophosphohydrolase [Pseudomonadota bacterium]